VGRFRFRKSPEGVIYRDTHRFVSAKTIGTSGDHSHFVIETFDGAAGNLPASKKRRRE